MNIGDAFEDLSTEDVCLLGNAYMLEQRKIRAEYRLTVDGILEHAKQTLDRFEASHDSDAWKETLLRQELFPQSIHRYLTENLLMLPDENDMWVQGSVLYTFNDEAGLFDTHESPRDVSAGYACAMVVVARCEDFANEDADTPDKKRKSEIAQRKFPDWFHIKPVSERDMACVSASGVDPLGSGLVKSAARAPV